MCDFYPGVSCGDPRFTGADGNNFYFHGKKDQDFCIVSAAARPINAHFIGKRNPSMSRDFTWIQALGSASQTTTSTLVPRRPPSGVMTSIASS